MATLTPIGHDDATTASQARMPLTARIGVGAAVAVILGIGIVLAIVRGPAILVDLAGMARVIFCY